MRRFKLTIYIQSVLTRGYELWVRILTSVLERRSLRESGEDHHQDEQHDIPHPLAIRAITSDHVTREKLGVRMRENSKEGRNIRCPLGWRRLGLTMNSQCHATWHRS